ncbi:uncharacterized protein LOC115343939 [Aquila chrysaetos chrysaetos]|uniref:uncharacterized protein LOC115343939 n=1 Tax=Aquila chrysaetos chrysaetos TaxID=223781 RepID=UPI0011771D13|nr:uncharacterized protein LOC115343939 [Aquila chrysaetos chrysaetos]
MSSPGFEHRWPCLPATRVWREREAWRGVSFLRPSEERRSGICAGERRGGRCPPPGGLGIVSTKRSLCGSRRCLPEERSGGHRVASLVLGNERGVREEKKKDDQKKRARPGFEPGTSRTLSENHTPRPTSRHKEPFLSLPEERSSAAAGSGPPAAGGGAGLGLRRRLEPTRAAGRSPGPNALFYCSRAHELVRGAEMRSPAKTASHKREVANGLRVTAERFQAGASL